MHLIKARFPCSGATMQKIILGLGLALVTPATIHAAAFAVYDQSATYLGNAYAGTSSAIQDASTSFYNPAGLKYLNKNQVVVSGVYNNSQAKISNANGLDSAGDVITGTNPSKPSNNILIPGFNASYQVNERVALGFSVVELFATDLKYSSTSIARYMATTTKISTVDISPSIGIMFHKKFYVGAALDVLKTNVNISSSVAWGGGLESLGYVNNNMNDWSTGFHAGVLFKPTTKLRMGLVYFSSFSLHLAGSTNFFETLDFGNPNQATSNFQLPDQINYSLTYDIGKKCICMAEVAWTHWSKIKTVTINYNSSALPGVLVFNFKNVWRVALGGDYIVNNKFTLKAGVSYDQSPVNNDHKTVRVPENDRYMGALGLRYTYNKWFSLVGAYSYTYMNNFTLHETAATDSLNNSPNVANRKVLNANVRNFTNKIGLQMVCMVK